LLSCCVEGLGEVLFNLIAATHVEKEFALEPR
jgi:hypothetical protein